MLPFSLSVALPMDGTSLIGCSADTCFLLASIGCFHGVVRNLNGHIHDAGRHQQPLALRLPSPHPVRRDAELEADMNTHQVTLNGQAVAVGRDHFKLLTMVRLMEHHNGVATESPLMSSRWRESMLLAGKSPSLFLTSR